MTLTKEYAQKWRDKRRAEGMCNSCAVRVPPQGKKQCDACAVKRKARERAHLKAGKCACGRPSREGKTKCQRCVDNHMLWRSRPENRKKIRDETNAKNRNVRLAVIAHYGGKCVCCEVSGHQFLTLDHINNDGFSDRENCTPYRWAKWVRENTFPTHLQILCWNCNLAKHHYGNGVCPHKLACA